MSIGYLIPFIYDDITGELKITNYNPKTRYITIKYKNKDINIFCGSLNKCPLGNLLNKFTTDFKIEIGTRFQDDKRDITITDREYRITYDKKNKKHNEKWYKYTCNVCGWTEGYINEYWALKEGGCSCCYNRTPVLGINTIWDTDRWMCDLGISEEDAKTHTKGSSDKVKIVCPECGNIKQSTINTISRTHTIGCICGDGYSIPNKTMFNILHQLNINFESEKKFNWCRYLFKSKFRQGYYDFYIPSMNLIIEMDGGWHSNDNKMNGRTGEESQIIDDEKDRLALEHGIEVIRIDCDYEGDNALEYIKKNILNNDRLNELFNISNIDWNECNKFALSNLVRMACDLWNTKTEDEIALDIANKMGYRGGTIRRYLKQGASIGWCNYDAEFESHKGRLKAVAKTKIVCGKPVEIFKNGVSLGIFKSVAELERQSEKLFGVKLFGGTISSVCLGKLNHYKNYKFRYV